MRRLAHDSDGRILVEFVLLLPTFLALMLGTIEFSIALHFWGNATKAAHWGARQAVVSAPVATGVQLNQYGGDWAKLIGTDCSVASGAAATDGSGVSLCKVVTVRCTGGSGTSGTCTTTQGGGAYGFDNDAFTEIFDRMRWIFPALDREHVEVTYRTNGLGFVARPGGLPLSVTVRIRCEAYQLQVLHGLINWPTVTNECGEPVRGIRLHDAMMTLTGEDYANN